MKIAQVKLNLLLWMISLLITCTGCHTLTRDGLPSVPPGEYLKPAFDERVWILMNRRADTNKSLTEYLPLGQSPLSWTESFGGTFFAEGSYSASLLGEYDEFIRNLRGSCPQITANVIKSSTHDLYYEWRVSGCEKQADQTEVGRFVKGACGIYRLAYVRKGAALTSNEREKWLSLLSQAELRSTNKNK